MSERLPPPPDRAWLLRDFRKRSLHDPRHHATQLVSRWIRCGYDLNELPALVTGLAPDIIEAGRADAIDRKHDGAPQ